MKKMFPAKKILCPTDFSDPSFVGLKGANEFAEHFSAVGEPEDPPEGPSAG
jgi:hypothetical protein